ncbi:hypothetical protein LCGC14_2240560, partial [marine sediment metagenome]
KCPLCDADMKVWRNAADLRSDAECAGCGLEFSVHDAALIRSADADDSLLEVTRTALADARAAAEVQ